MIVAGIGFRASATEAAMIKALTLTGQKPDLLACLETRKNPALTAFAARLALPLVCLDETEIAGLQTLTCSPRIKSRFATGSVAEALALAAARKGGFKARLIAARVQSACGMATAALAERIIS
jgi:cobalt-precorrin 5A hydrolase